MTSALEQIVCEAVQSHRLAWAREFGTTDDATEAHVAGNYESLTRCIAYTLGGVYPRGGYDSEEMREWSELLTVVRTIISNAVEEYPSPFEAARVALDTLGTFFAAAR